MRSATGFTTALVAALLVVGITTAPLVAQSSPPAAPPAADARPAAGVAGRWRLAVDIQSQDNNSVLTLVVDGTKVSGSISGTTTFPIAGQYTDGKLSFAMDYNGQLTISFSGALKDDGSLAGTMDYGQGVAAWTATRVEEK